MKAWALTSSTENYLKKLSFLQKSSMASSSLSIWLIPLILLPPLLFLIKKKIYSKTKHNHLPPGPPRLPILGNLHQLGALPHRSVWKLSKKYGPVMYLQLGFVPTIFISSANSAKEVLKDHDLDCCTRPALTGPGRFSYNFQDISFAPYGESWRETRKICVMELFSVKKVQSFHYIIEEEISCLMKSISESASSGAVVDLSEKLFSLVGSIVFRVGFGKRLKSSGFDGAGLKEFMDEAFVVMGSFNGSDYLPYIGWIVDKLSGFHKKLERSFKLMNDLFERLLDDHLNDDGSIEDQNNVLDVLLKLEKDQVGSGTSQLTKDRIKAIMMDIFLAGVDTSAITINWAMSELARNPRVMKKAQDELRASIGKYEKITEGSIDRLQYLKMIVKETLRLHPPACFLLPRETISQFKINGYIVNPKTRVEVNIWAIGRDPNHWKNPDEFYPERFLENSMDMSGKHFEFLPFGSGRRGCPGMYMGTTTVELTLANMLHEFDWKLPDGIKETDIDLEESGGLTVKKKSALYLVPIDRAREA